MVQIDQIYKIYLKAEEVTTDSRNCDTGSLFVALKGEKFDGNRFASAALDQGAIAAIVDDPLVVDGDRYILVDDGLSALQELARHHRLQFNIPIIAITGSNGKTTTKNLITSILSSHYACHSTQGNFNNHIGVPLTLLAMPSTTEVCVLEMGANHVGEIAQLCEIGRPTHGLITNVGKAHLEGFGGLEGVKKAKGELYDFLSRTGGVAFINQTEPHLAEMAAHVQKKIFYDNRELDYKNGDYLVEMLAEMPFIKIAYHDIKGHRQEAESHLFGRYNFQNIMTAVSVGKYFRVPAGKIKKAVEGYRPKSNRSQVIDYRGGQVILDAYNANPTSMKNALTYFSNRAADSKLAILGEMLELGEFSEAEHLDIVKLALDLDIDEIVLVGKAFAPAARQFQLRHVDSVELLQSWWSNIDLKGITVLLKGSRGIRLEMLVLPPVPGAN